MGWKCQVCEKDWGGTEQKPILYCGETPGCKQKGEFACKWVDNQSQPWQKSELLHEKNMYANSKEDFNILLSMLKDERIYIKNIGTIVGGKYTKAKAKPKIKLKDESSRIDMQSKPSNSTYNLQYQQGKVTLACVLYHNDDSPDDVKHHLRESFIHNQKVKSPNFRKK